MMKKNAITIVSSIALLLFLSSCVYERDVEEMIKQCKGKNVTEITATVYSDNELDQICNFKGNLAQYSRTYLIECIREEDAGKRAVYRGDSGFAIIYFNQDGEKLLGEVVHSSLFLQNFTQFKEGDSLESVRNLDPDGKYTFLETGKNDTPKTSIHYTKDGFLILIHYNQENKIVKIETTLI